MLGQAPNCRGKKSPGCSAPGVADYKKKGLFIGYRGYEKERVTPAFCFGHGLSFTTFEYRHIKASSSSVTVDVMNMGTLAGADIPQLYIRFPSTTIGEPEKQLRGFNKTVVLAPGAKATVEFPLRPRDLSIWSVATHNWEVQKGTFAAMVGHSSCNVVLNTTFESV